MRLAIAFVVALSAAGCRGDAPDVVTTTTHDSAGVTIVESAGPGWDSTSAWTVSAEPTLRIGSIDAGGTATPGGSVPAENFTWVSGVTRLSDGRIVVLDQQTREVRWFGPDGSHLLTRGGPGGGPGKFDVVTALLKLPGDTLLVRDRPRSRKLVFFAPDASLIREEIVDSDLDRELARFGECAQAILRDGSTLECIIEPGGPPRPSIGGYQPPPGPFRLRDRFVHVPRTVDSFQPLGVHGGIEQWVTEGAGGQVSFASHPFFSRTWVATGGMPEKIAIAINPHYSIELWRPTGELERIVRRPGPRRAATRAQLEQARDEVLESVRRDPVNSDRVMAEIEEPDSIPAVQGLVFGLGNELWVKRDVHYLDDRSIYDVFDGAGSFLGELTFPPRFRIHEVGEDYLLGVRTDELGVPFVELYALDRGIRAGN